MSGKKVILKTGTRKSKLSLAQTKQTLGRLSALFGSISFEILPLKTTGDKDKKTDLRTSDPDFFTRELDNKILSGELDLAVHSAKDLADPLKKGIDYFRLPWHEDQRDVLVFPEFSNKKSLIKKIGVSSVRREDYCRRQFPGAKLLSVRGNVEERISQLDKGKYDLLILAAAGLIRLGLENRISEYISLEKLPPPDGQGYLALTFCEGKKILKEIRKLFVHPVFFAGAGPGNPGLVTMATVNALKKCDICLYDALIPTELLNHLPKSGRAVFVGKRRGRHSFQQDTINTMIADFARQGKSVVRLKGGDPGIFGRLSEEIQTLEQLELPYRVIPGISSLLAATTSTGLHLTRRGVSRGFSVMTPRKAGSKDYEEIGVDEISAFPKVFFMGASEITKIINSLKKQGYSGKMPVAAVISAGCSNERIISGTLDTIKVRLRGEDISGPGLFLAGKNFDIKYLYKNNGPLKGVRVLVTCSENIQAKACCEILRLGGVPVKFPLISFRTEKSVAKYIGQINSYDWIAVTSPYSVIVLLEKLRESGRDIRTLPKIMVCGPGTAANFREVGIEPDLVAKKNFGTKGIIDAAKKILRRGEKVLRLRSDKADSSLSDALKKMGAELTDSVLYRNLHVKVKNKKYVGDIDAAIFASGSALESFIDNFGKEKLKGKLCTVMRGSTLETAGKYKIKSKLIISEENNISGQVSALAAYCINKNIVLQKTKEKSSQSC